MTIDVLNSATMDDMITVETSAAKVGGASAELVQRILRDADVLVVAQVRVACIAGGRAARLPKAVRSALSAQMETAR